MDERATPTAFHFPDSVSSDHIQHFTAYTSFKPVEIHMLDPRQGWSVAVDSGQDRHILRTQDSGQTWQDVTPPEPASAPRQNGKHLLPYFLDSRVAWAVYWTTDQDTGPVFEAKVWYTGDGGQEWYSSSDIDTSAWEGGYAQPAYLDFIDNQNGFLALKHDPGAGQAPISIYRSQDGGVNWTIVKEPMAPEDSYIDACCQTGMVFIDPLNGVITKDPGPVAQTYLVWTQDGGATWNDQQPPPTDQMLFESGLCGTFSPTTITPGMLQMIVNCPQDASPNSPPSAYLYTTTDAGRSWNSTPLPDLPWDQAVWPSLRRTDWTQFLNSQEGWLSTTASYENPDLARQQIRTFLSHTTDGGATWTPIGEFPGSGQFNFGDPQYGWAVVQDGEYLTFQRTIDGGTSWEEIPAMVASIPAAQQITKISGSSEIPHFQQNQEFQLKNVKMIDAIQGWALTRTNPSDGHVMVTRDGGASWSDVSPPEPVANNSGNPKRPTAFFLDAQHAWVTYYPDTGTSYDPALVWRTEDGGATWYTGQPLTRGNIEGSFAPSYLYFIDDEQGWLLMVHGVAAGSQPVTLYHTQDGGQTWPLILEMLSPGGDAINTCCQSGMLFADPLSGLITTNLGPDPSAHVSWTQDGGKSWQRQDLSLLAGRSSEAICGTLSPVFSPPDAFYLLIECLNPAMPGDEPDVYFYATSDSGGHWTSISLPEPEPEGKEWQRYHRNHRIEFVNPQIGWFIVNYSSDSNDGKSQKMLTYVYQTRDGGRSWQPFSKVNWGGVFSFIDASTGWAIAQDYPQHYAFVKTDDGGLSWDIIHPILTP